MRGRSPLQSLAASPTMVGAITTLIVIVAVFLAYNANNGLPFVPVYRVSVEVPNAARVVRNNEVRIGGHRVGVVESIEVTQPTGEEAAEPPSEAEATDEEVFGGTSPDEAAALLNLKLDQSAEPLPVDSVFRVRYRSSFGLKYLEITRGEGEAAPEGFVFSDPDSFVAQTEFDDINNTFDAETRENARINLTGFGDAFAGRGMALNETIRELNPLFENLRPVARALTKPATQLERFFPELADSARIVAPVAAQQAEFFTNAAIAFAAISEDPVALMEGISEGVPTLETGIETLPRQRPFLRDFTTLSRELRPGIEDLVPTLPVLNDAIETGTPVLVRSVEMNVELARALGALEDLVEQPSTMLTLQRLENTFDTAKPLAEFVVPSQTVCNYWNYWFTHLPNALSDRDQVGNAFRQWATVYPSGPRRVAVGSSPEDSTTVIVPGDQEAPLSTFAGFQAGGREFSEEDERGGVFKPFELAITHGNVYGPTGQQDADCQGGQFGNPLGQLLVPGQSLARPGNVVSDLPGSRGPTTAFYYPDGTRTLVDTRVESRQP